MLDIKRIRDEPESVTQALLKRMDTVDLQPVIEQDSARRRLRAELEAKQSRRNSVSADVPRLRKAGQDVSGLFVEMKNLGAEIKSLEAKLAEVESGIGHFLATLPNLPDADVQAGGKENNEVIGTFGQPPQFDFKPREHVQLLTTLGLVDYERGVKLGGSGFWLYTGDGARLEWALLNYFLERHTEHGYEFVLPPHLLLQECGYVAGQFPKFAEDVFSLDRADSPGSFLLPTAETALVNLHRGEILAEASLPRRYCAYTPCFRREAGSYRTEERGTIRGHQFNKVELFQYCLPTHSDTVLQEMLSYVRSLVEALGLHHQVSKLAAKDCSAGMAKTYDIEVWIPSMGQFKEISSASNARDYQARRGQIRFRPANDRKPELLHTLNASGLATSRLLPAIVEQFQTAEGNVVIPEPLRKWMGKDLLRPPS